MIILQAAVYAEFFHQGELEKQRGLSPQEMMDRDRAFIPDLQLQFLKNIALPAYRYFSMFYKINIRWLYV